MRRKKSKQFARVSLGVGLFLSLSSLHAVQFDGSGHYGLRGELQTQPGSATNRGLHRAAQPDFGLKIEARSTDKLSTFLDLKIFEDPRNTYLGDKVRQKEALLNDPDYGSDSSIDNPQPGQPYQSTFEPRYELLSPKISQAYARYATYFGILEVGRRARDWGLGIFLSDGSRHFQHDQSVFDGVSVDINIEKNQTLGVKLGYDKLAETGRGVRSYIETNSREYGPTNIFDDLDQFFLALEYDDSHAAIEGGLSKEIAVYAAKVQSSGVGKGGTSTEMSIVDFYSALTWRSVEWKSEVVATWGKSSDPTYAWLGGRYFDDGGYAVRNKVNALALAMDFAWDIESSGSYLGPKEFRLGDFTRHQLIGGLAYAPGDSDGYSDNNDVSDAYASEQQKEAARNLPLIKRVENREAAAKAFAFHQNFKPALIMFNGHDYLDDLRVDGVYHPSRVMNATVLSGGYRYFSLINGEFTARLISASLNTEMPKELKEYYDQNPAEDRPIGTYGSDLGWELDLSYNYHFSPQMKLGVAGAAHLPGAALRTREDKEFGPTVNYLLQSSLEFTL